SLTCSLARSRAANESARRRSATRASSARALAFSAARSAAIESARACWAFTRESGIGCGVASVWGAEALHATTAAARPVRINSWTRVFMFRSLLLAVESGWLVRDHVVHAATDGLLKQLWWVGGQDHPGAGRRFTPSGAE